ncbi:unnamed protein product [Prorocentrum cordatum]|uniref:Uncharacterized protein n=1 Tax=Prorocentrum cordatum TaxID=2364126 RepID=A0ABN9WWL7_9DINO|nr:unnamed protein product [Polarella glacialis]
MPGRPFCGAAPPGRRGRRAAPRGAVAEATREAETDGEVDVEDGLEPEVDHWAELEAAKAKRGLTAKLPWPRSTCEVMIDAMTTIQHFWRKAGHEKGHLRHQSDIFTLWPAKVVQAAAALRPRYADRDRRPPSPWEPIMVVYDYPNPRRNWMVSPRIDLWKHMSQQGPRVLQKGLSIAFADTYTENLDELTKGRCDQEIMYMIELLTREFPRRQVLVTGDPKLQRLARSHCLVRSPKWLEQELLRTGEPGKRALKAFEPGDDSTYDEVMRLPNLLQDLWLVGM